MHGQVAYYSPIQVYEMCVSTVKSAAILAQCT